MATDFKAAADAVLNRVITSEPRVPGVVAMVTDSQRNIYEGAAGKRRLDHDADMTTDTVFGIFSTTKAITGTAALQLVEEGKLDLDAPAKTYVPEIGELKVELVRAGETITLSRPQTGVTASLTRTGKPDALVPLARRETRECLAEDMRRLDADEIYLAALQGIDKVTYAQD